MDGEESFDQDQFNLSDISYISSDSESDNESFIEIYDQMVQSSIEFIPLLLRIDDIHSQNNSIINSTDLLILYFPEGSIDSDETESDSEDIEYLRARHNNTPIINDTEPNDTYESDFTYSPLSHIGSEYSY